MSGAKVVHKTDWRRPSGVDDWSITACGIKETGSNVWHREWRYVTCKRCLSRRKKAGKR